MMAQNKHSHKKKWKNMKIERNNQTKARMKSIWRNVKPKGLNVTLGLSVKILHSLISEAPFRDVDP